jgi:hypothetical protein
LDTITPREAAAMLATDNRGQPAISPTARARIEADRVARMTELEAENARLKREIEELKATWQDRLASEIALRVRGMRRD